MESNLSQSAAIIQCKCPRCRKGNMFKYPLRKIHKFNKMHEYCPHCNLHLEPEPGFYFGAMYISYGFNIAILVTFFIATNIFIEKPEVWQYLVSIILPSLLFVPINFRISRSLMLHLFGGIKYRPEEAEKS